MKLNSTLILTFVLLLMMVGTGSVSAWWGYNMGSDALEGVSEPDSNPTKKLTRKQGENKQSELVFIKERDVIVQNYDHTQGKKTNNLSSSKEKPSSNSSENTDNKENKSEETSDNDSFISSPTDAVLLDTPVQSKDQDIILEVQSIKQRSGAVLLNVSLKNDGRKAIRFLYSFLDIRDDQGNLLSAITDGLPGELPANGEPYTGTIRIPSSLLLNSKTISLNLTDYPDQKVQLKLNDLPVSLREEAQETSDTSETDETTTE